MLNRRALLQGLVGAGAVGGVAAGAEASECQVVEKKHPLFMQVSRPHNTCDRPAKSQMTLRMVFCSSARKNSMRHEDYSVGNVSTMQLIAALERSPHNFNDLRRGDEDFAVLWAYPQSGKGMPLMVFEVESLLGDCPLIRYWYTSFGDAMLLHINSIPPSAFITGKSQPSRSLSPLSINEIRAREGLSSVPWGDSYIVG